jgi:hypothetical protein
MAIDPSGGGTGSDYAILTGCMDDGRHVVCGIDASSSTKHDEIVRVLTTHVRSLRQKKSYADAWIYVYIEANMSWLSADLVAGILQTFHKVKVVSMDASKHQRYGVWTGNNEKENYAATIQKLLRDHTLFFAKDLIGENLVRDLESLYRQLRVFRKETRAPADAAFGKWVTVWTGKSPNQKDDLCMALQIWGYWMNVKRSEQDFVEWAQQHSVRIS